MLAENALTTLDRMKLMLGLTNKDATLEKLKLMLGLPTKCLPWLGLRTSKPTSLSSC